MLLIVLAILATLPVLAEQRFKARIPMRDGVRLSASVFLPLAEGRFPAILVRTPYGKGPDLNPSYRIFLERGYAMVIQDVRGEKFALRAGMPVQVLVPLKKRTALQYAFEPLTQSLWRSFREH